eukprot:sb/3476632/
MDGAENAKIWVFGSDFSQNLTFLEVSVNLKSAALSRGGQRRLPGVHEDSSLRRLGNVMHIQVMPTNHSGERTDRSAGSRFRAVIGGRDLNVHDFHISVPPANAHAAYANNTPLPF